MRKNNVNSKSNRNRSSSASVTLGKSKSNPNHTTLYPSSGLSLSSSFSKKAASLKSQTIKRTFSKNSKVTKTSHNVETVNQNKNDVTDPPSSSSSVRATRSVGKSMERRRKNDDDDDDDDDDNDPHDLAKNKREST
eukprot:Pgem_evm1s18857